MNQSRRFTLHFVGIGGIGMSGIAEIFLSQGHRVRGSDLSSNEVTERLVRMGATIVSGHDEKNISECDVVVISSAVKSTNPEVLEAKRRGIPVIPRAEMLAEIMRGKVGIAVSGTHGKTTTTSMVSQIFIHADLDPTVVVGGKVEAIGSNAKAGTGNIVVAEADESDGSFLLLPASYSVVTNIDHDHMEYYGTTEKLHEAFTQFTKKMPFYGCTWLCGDDAGVKQILSGLTKPHLTYGFEPQNDILIQNWTVTSHSAQKFEIWLRPQKNEAHVFSGTIELGVLGKHNVLNAVAAAGVGLGHGLPIHVIAEALKAFKHVRRRFDERYYLAERNIRLVDDYGHHPTEIKAVLSTAKQTGHDRIVTIFQPHRFSRTKLCWNEFLHCFQDTDVLLMLPIYSAGEDPIEGINSHELCSQVTESARLGKRSLLVQEVESLEAAEKWVLNEKKEGDLILTLGAGSITKLADLLAKKL